MKEKKELDKKTLIIRKYLFKSLALLGLFLPMFILVCVKWDVYFTENTHAWSVGIGGIMVAFFTILLCKVGFKKMHPVAWAIFLVLIVQCFYSIIQDARPISYVFLVGVIIYTIFDTPSKYYSKLLGIWNDEEIREQVRKPKKQKVIKEDDEGGRA